MVVVDSSALIPLARVGRLDLIRVVFDEIRTTTHVRDEVLIEGKRGTAALTDFVEGVTICEPPVDADDVASLEGVTTADAGVLLLAAAEESILLGNDKGLIKAAQSHGVECWWVRTLLLKCTKERKLTGADATGVLYDLVDEGMNMSPKVYAQIQRQLQEFDD